MGVFDLLTSVFSQQLAMGFRSPFVVCCYTINKLPCILCRYYTFLPFNLKKQLKFNLKKAEVRFEKAEAQFEKDEVQIEITEFQFEKDKTQIEKDKVGFEIIEIHFEKRCNST